jgi:hypothetical protein
LPLTYLLNFPKSFTDLEWLAKTYPQALGQERILKFLSAYLPQPAFHITTEERTKIPPLGKTPLVKTIRREVLQFGDVRDKEGALLKKERGKKAFFCAELLRLIHSALPTDVMLPVKAWRFQPKEDGKIGLKFVYNTVEEKAFPKDSLYFILEKTAEGS